MLAAFKKKASLLVLSTVEKHIPFGKLIGLKFPVNVKSHVE